MQYEMCTQFSPQMMYLSSQMAITKFHRLCKFNNRNFSQF